MPIQRGFLFCTQATSNRHLSLVASNSNNEVVEHCPAPFLGGDRGVPR